MDARNAIWLLSVSRGKYVRRMFLARNARGFTLIELLVVVGVIALLIALAFPVFGTIQERARITQDMNNLRQIGLGTQMYLNDNDGVLFPAATWPSLLNTDKYLPSSKVFQSPFDSPPKRSDPLSYGLNAKLAGLSVDKIVNATISIVFAAAPDAAKDANTPVTFSGTLGTGLTVSQPPPTPFSGTHSKRRRIDVCLADWHVENMSWEDFSASTPAQRWDPTAATASPTPAP